MTPTIRFMLYFIITSILDIQNRVMIDRRHLPRGVLHITSLKSVSRDLLPQMLIIIMPYLFIGMYETLPINFENIF